MLIHYKLEGLLLGYHQGAVMHIFSSDVAVTSLSLHSSKAVHVQDLIQQTARQLINYVLFLLKPIHWIANCKFSFGSHMLVSTNQIVGGVCVCNVNGCNE